MANEEKYRIEAPDDDEEPEEKKGFLRPLPTAKKIEYVDKDGRPQPVVRLLGVSMPEKRKDLLMLIMIPALVGIIDATIYSFIITHSLPNNATYLFFVPIIIAIPIGLTSSEAGSGLIGGILGAIFFLIFLITFLSSPGILLPELGMGSFLLSAFAISVAYFILVVVATLLGTVVGIVLREFM
jgi:hypothetical protein